MMPIVIRPDLSPAAVAIACAHGGLAGYLKWNDDKIVKDWITPEINKAFFKRLYVAQDLKQFNIIKTWNFEKLILTESKLDNLETIIIFKPLYWSKSLLFNELKLYQ